MLTFDFNKINLINESCSMLDVGCGEGRHIFGLMQKFPDLHCTGLDLHDDSLKKSQEGYEFFKSISNAGAEFIKGSVYSLPFPDNSFDLVVCSEVLEHLYEYKDAIVEINRVLKPGGAFLVSVPSAWPEKICWAISTEYQNQPGGHLRIFKKNNLVNEISERGFDFIQSEKFHSIHSPYWWLRCLFWKNQETNILVRAYKKFLEVHILKKPLWIDLIDRSLNPIMGKSTAMYFTKK